MNLFKVLPLIEMNIMPETTVLSIRINKKTRQMIENQAKILKMKVSMLAARVLEDETENWSKKYAESIYKELFKEE